MRGRALLSAALAVTFGVFALTPQPAQAGGETVAVTESFAPGTILVRTSERQLIFSSATAAPFVIRSASGAPASNGRGILILGPNTFVPIGRRPTRSVTIIPACP